MNDEPRNARPVEVTTEDNIAVVRAMVEEDALVTHAQLHVERTIEISSESVRTILLEKLVFSLC